MWQKTFTIGNIPLLALAQDDSTERPVVLFYHGLTSTKDTHRLELQQLAERGFLALGVDAVGHGQRSIGDLQAFLNRGRGFLPQVYKLLMPTLEEIPWLVEALRDQGYSRFAVAGISFGGLITYGAPLVEPTLEGAVPILATPDWGDVRFSPVKHLEEFESIKLFGWNAGKDVHVPPAAARAFFAELKRRNPSNSWQEYREYAKSGHFMRPQDWDLAWPASLDWLERLFAAIPCGPSTARLTFQ
jgi:dienelactone hydrolase